MNITFQNLKEDALKTNDSIIFFIDDTLSITTALKKFSSQYGSIVEALLNNNNFFKGKFGQMKTLTINVEGAIKHLLLVGVGKVAELKEFTIEELGAKIFSKLGMLNLETAVINLEENFCSIDIEKVACLLVSGAKLISYKFDKYITKKEEDKGGCIKLTISMDHFDKAKELFEKEYEPVIEGVFMTKDVISEPPNVLYPESYADRIKEELSPLGIKVTVLGEKKMEQLGMNALLGVGRGSSKESQLVIMEYNGDAEAKTIALVGKGVCFDSGGISLKPANRMWDMKYDMGGSGAVAGLMKTIAKRKAKTNVIGVVGLVENMPDGNAQRPADVVKSMSGQTIEVLNTDAEGRLVLADALWYTQSKFKPEIMIDLATLTGAISVSLASVYAGLFSNNDELAEKIIKAGIEVNEKVWRMPMCKEFDDLIKSKIADVANINTGESGAGASTAAQFLQKFVNNVPWAHLDIAGVTWNFSNKALAGIGASGWGVRLLNKFITDNYELKNK